MKMSVSLPSDDVAFVDEYAARAGLPSRSSVLHEAIRLLRMADLERDYAAAWQEWAAGGDSSPWDRAIADGLDDAPR
jgi:Arc/MetJ-type ribon-helix-helix transcriptional regulator